MLFGSMTRAFGERRAPDQVRGRGWASRTASTAASIPRSPSARTIHPTFRAGRSSSEVSKSKTPPSRTSGSVGNRPAVRIHSRPRGSHPRCVQSPFEPGGAGATGRFVRVHRTRSGAGSSPVMHAGGLAINVGFGGVGCGSAALPAVRALEVSHAQTHGGFATDGLRVGGGDARVGGTPDDGTPAGCQRSESVRGGLRRAGGSR